MKLFKCQFCGNIVYFENRSCEVCGHRLAYRPAQAEMTAIEPLGENWWKPLNAPEQKRLLCINAQYDACNWFVPDDTTDAFCLACRHNAVVPDVSQPQNLAAWQHSNWPSTGCSIRCCAGSCRSRPCSRIPRTACHSNFSPIRRRPTRQKF